MYLNYVEAIRSKKIRFKNEVKVATVDGYCTEKRQDRRMEGFLPERSGYCEPSSDLEHEHAVHAVK